MLKNVFLGVDTNWNQVPGSNRSTTIDPIGRNSAAGQYTFFQQSVLGGATQASNVAQDTSDGLVQVGIEKDASSIGYVGLAHSKGSHEKALKINGIGCNARNIKKKTYPLFRYDWAVLPTSHPSSKVEKFFNWVAEQRGSGQNHQPGRRGGRLQRVGAHAALRQQRHVRGQRPTPCGEDFLDGEGATQPGPSAPS